MNRTNRRTFLRLAGAATMASVVAGCTESEGSGDESDAGDTDGDAGGGDETGAGDANGDGTGGEDGDAPQEIDDYLSDANEYDGSVDDVTGEDEVTVDVGGGPNGLAFSPAAIRVDAETTVVWEWTGEGGAHNVVAEDGAFESELYSKAGETFEHTFDETGIYTYYCDPHEASGMKGGVVVE